MDYFENIKLKHLYKFLIMFDIKQFDPPIKENFLTDALKLANKEINITFTNTTFR